MTNREASSEQQANPSTFPAAYDEAVEKDGTQDQRERVYADMEQ